MSNAMDISYDLTNTPSGQFYEVRGRSWYITPKEGVMRAVGAVWYSRIVWYGVNQMAGALPPNQTPQFVFSNK